MSVQGHQRGGIGGIDAKRGGLVEEATRGKITAPRVEKGSAEGVTQGCICLHQGFESGRQLGDTKAKVARELAVGNGLPRSREG